MIVARRTRAGRRVSRRRRGVPNRSRATTVAADGRPSRVTIAGTAAVIGTAATTGDRPAMTDQAMTDQATSAPPASASAPGEWLVLAEGRRAAPPRALMPMRRMAVLTVVAAVAVAAAVAVGGSLVARRSAESEAVHNVAQLTDVLARSVVQPALTDAMPRDPAAARRTLDPIVRRSVIDGSVVRVKLWNATGTVLYSDEPRLVGRRFPLDDDARQALAKPRTLAGISDLRRPENRLDRNRGRLLEVYRPVWTPDGTPLLFETYFRYGTVAARSRELSRGFGGIMLTSIAALLLLLAPLVWALVNRTRRARAEREQATAWALEASNEERRHIAATLHDGVVQQLAATAFAIAGEARRAASSGDQDLDRRLTALAGTTRDTIAGLRSLLVDIYPPSLHTSTLSAALTDLARVAGSGGPAVEVCVEDAVADHLTSDARQAAFRVTQEALRNAARHSGADAVLVSLGANAMGEPVLTIDDDGRGFAADSAVSGDRPGHFGLRLMADAATAGGARLEVASAPGAGAHLRMSWPSE